MGIGPAAAKANDTICVLFGGQVLYVIRAKDGERHEFIGECYVHGFMDGEAVEGCDTEGGPQSQTFILTWTYQLLDREHLNEPTNNVN